MRLPFPLLLSITAFALPAQQPADSAPATVDARWRTEPIPDPRGIQGTVFLAGGGRLAPELMAEFVRAAGGSRARIVVVPTASASADDAGQRDELAARWRQQHEVTEVTVLHSRNRDEADSEAFTAPLRDATGVWFGGGDQQRIADAYLGTRFERELHAVLQRGGAVGGTSAGAAIGSRTMIAGGRAVPELATGFDLVPGAVIDQHFSQRSRMPRLQQALAAVPGRFGIGIDEGTALALNGRRLRAVGSGNVHVLLPRTEHHPERVVALAAGDTLDLPTWQRAARNRTLGPWPVARRIEPSLAKGALVIVGGGALPEEITARFVALAGGTKARIVFVSGAETLPLERDPPVIARFREHGAQAVSRLDHRHPDEWNDEARELVAGATGIWFGGGRQWRLCDAYDGTDAVSAFHGVLERGGVIGGSSAGATIQGDHLVRGNPLGNTDMWCEGYDRGFAFLRGVAIDQHFLARNRMADLTAFVERFPQVLGIGIDEATAAVVEGERLEVLGDSKVVLLRKRALEPLEPMVLSRGQQVDLRTLAPR